MAKSIRYNENIGLYGLTAQAQEKLTSAKVLIMGAGGLGSSVIMNLVALGVGQIKIIDKGTVKEEELNRQTIHKFSNIGRAKVISAKEWIQEFNHDIKVELDKVELNELNYFNTIMGYDIIIDCFNSLEERYMLNEIALRHNKILIHGNTNGFWGQVTTIVPKQTGCLNCVLQKPITFKKEDKKASLITTTNIIGSLQAQEALKVITDMGEPLFNKLLVYDGTKNKFQIVEYTKNMVCKSCSEYV